MSLFLPSSKELAIRTVRIGKSHLNNIQINLKFFISVLCHFIWWTQESGDDGTLPTCDCRFSILCKFQLVFSFLTLPLCYFNAFPSWCSQQLCNVEIIFKLSNDRLLASCAARVRLDHTLSGLIKAVRMREFGSTRVCDSCWQWSCRLPSVRAARSTCCHIIEG